MNDLQKIAGLYRGFLLFNLGMLVIIFVVFPEPFSLLRDPLSWLGKTGSGNGLAFYKSFWLFSAALIFNIARWSHILYQLARQPAWRKPLVRIAGWSVLVGFILLLLPYDISDAIHSAGGSLVGLGMWVFSTLLLLRSAGMLKPVINVGLHLILHASALYCIYSFALNTPLKGLSQRPAILAIVVVTNICLYLQLRELQQTGKREEIDSVDGL